MSAYERCGGGRCGWSVCPDRMKHRPLSPRGLEMLKILAEDGEDCEPVDIVCEGLDCFIGDDRTNTRSVNVLLRLLLLKDVSDHPDSRLRRYEISQTGRELLKHPKPFVAARLIAEAIAKGDPFCFTAERGVHSVEEMIADMKGGSARP